MTFFFYFIRLLESKLKNDVTFMVAYVFHHLSDHYAHLSENYTDLSDNKLTWGWQFFLDESTRYKSRY